MSMLMDKISKHNTDLHMPDSGLEDVDVVANDVFVQSVKTVYSEDSALTPALSTVKAYDGGNVMVLPHIEQIHLPESTLRIRSRDYITRIELVDFPPERYSLKINTTVYASSKDNCFDLENPSSKAMAEFYELIGQINNYQGLHQPLKKGLPAMFPLADQIRICYPKKVVLPRRCLVRLTGFKNSELLKSPDTQVQKSWVIDITPHNSYNVLMMSIPTKYLVFKLPPDSWISFSINGTEIVNLKSHVSASHTKNVIVSFHGNRGLYRGDRAKYLVDKQLIDFGCIDMCTLKTNIPRQECVLLQGGYRLVRQYPDRTGPAAHLKFNTIFHDD